MGGRGIITNSKFRVGIQWGGQVQSQWGGQEGKQTKNLNLGQSGGRIFKCNAERLKQCCKVLFLDIRVSSRGRQLPLNQVVLSVHR